MSVLRMPSSLSIDKNFSEGVVSSVDPVRMFCQVKTIRGQNLSYVTWLLPSGGASRSGMHVTPVIGDRVLVVTATGYPIIVGFLPKIIAGETFGTPIDSGINPSDTGNFSPVGSGQTTDPNKPGDMNVGDHIITSSGGGLLGVLRGGSIILKSSRLAQIFISKYDDLVRIVGRNYEVFSDLASKAHVSMRGRIYGFLGIADTLQNSRAGLFKYKEYVGDTALAEHLEDNYQNAVSANFPTANTIIKKQVVKDATGNPLMVLTVDLSGETKKTVQGIPGSGLSTVEDHLPAEHKTTSTSNSDVGAVDITPTSVTVSCTNGSMSEAVFTKNSATITYNNSATVVLDSSGVNCTFGGHFVKIDSSGVHLG